MITIKDLKEEVDRVRNDRNLSDYEKIQELNRIMAIDEKFIDNGITLLEFNKLVRYINASILVCSW